MSETWYRVTDYSKEITTVEAERSTDNFIFVKESGGKIRRRHKSTSWENFFPSREFAKKYLVSLYKRRIDSALETANREKANLEIVEAL